MNQHRTAVKFLAGMAVVAGLVGGVSAPAQAGDTGWGRTAAVDTDHSKPAKG